MMSLAVFRPVLLTLSLLLCSESSEFVEEGGNITLPCNNVREGQRECDGTTWIFNSAEKPREIKELIGLGKIVSSVPETLSNRLRVTQNCSLTIQNVQPQDAGRFYCEQYDQSGRLLSPDDPVYLSVVSLTKEKYEKTVQFRCSVSSSLSGVEIKWLLNGRDVNNLNITTKNLGDSIVFTVQDSHVHYKHLNQFKCEVTDAEKKKIFSLRSNKPGKTTTETTITQTKKGQKDTRETTNVSEPKPKTEAEDAQTTASPQNWSTGWLWAVIAAVAGVLVTVVVVVIWRRLTVRRADTRSDPPVSLSGEPEEEEVSYVNIRHNRKNKRNVVRHSEEEVTYRSVRNTSVEDPDQLYATINK